MGDMGEVFNEMTKDRKQRHKEWHSTNRAIIDESGIAYTDKGETLIFREGWKPKVDFYPSTGRWRVAGEKLTYRGGAKKFLKWYNKL